jgi:hypothetical protein
MRKPKGGERMVKAIKGNPRSFKGETASPLPPEGERKENPMKAQNHKLPTMDINEASKIVGKAQKEEGWFDRWNALNDDLQFVTSSLDVIVGYCMNDDGENPLITTVDDLKSRVERIQKNLDEVIERLGEKYRLGPHLPKPKEKRIFILPKVVLEKYRLL